MRVILLALALVAAQDFGTPVFSQSGTFIETQTPGTQRNDDDPCIIYNTEKAGLTFGPLTITSLCCTDKSQPLDGSKNSNIERSDWFTLYAGTSTVDDPALDCELRFEDNTDPETFLDTIFVYEYPIVDSKRVTINEGVAEKLTADPIPAQLNILSPPPLSTGDLGGHFDGALSYSFEARVIIVEVFNEVLVEDLGPIAAVSSPSGVYIETTKPGTQRNDNDPCFIWEVVTPGNTLGTLTMTELCCTDKNVPIDIGIGANIERQEWFDLFTSLDDVDHNPGLDCELRFEDSDLPGVLLDTIFVYQYPIGDDGARITFGSGITPETVVVQKLTSDPQPIQLNVFSPPPTSTGDVGDGFDGSDDSPRSISIDVFGGKNLRKVVPPAPTGAFIETTVHGTQVNDNDDCFIFDLSTAGLSFGDLSLTDLCCADKSNPVDGSANHGIGRDEWYTLYNSDDKVNNPAMDCEARFEDAKHPGTFHDTIFVFQYPLAEDGNGRVTISPPVPQKLTTDPIPIELNIFSPPPIATGDLGVFFHIQASQEPDLPRLVNMQVSDAKEVKKLSDVSVPAPTGGFVEGKVTGEQRNDGDPCFIWDLKTIGVKFDTLTMTELCCTDKNVPIDVGVGANIEREEWFDLFRSGSKTNNPGLDCELRFTDSNLPGETFDTIFVYQYPVQSDGSRITTGSGITVDIPVTQKLTSDPVPIQLNVFAPPPTSLGDLGSRFTGSKTQEESERSLFVTIFAASDIVEVSSPTGDSGASAAPSSGPPISAILAVIFISLTVMSLSLVVWHFKCRGKAERDQGISLEENVYHDLKEDTPAVVV